MPLRSRHVLVLGGVGLALGAALGAAGVAVAGPGSPATGVAAGTPSDVAAGVPVAGSGPGSTARDRSGRPGAIVREDRQAFLDDVAKRAGVSADKLRAALDDLRQTAGLGPRFGGLMAGVDAAADYLGLQPRALVDQLRTKTLAQVAADRGKSVDGLKQALRGAAKTALDRARSNGRLTQQQEDAALKRLDDSLDDLVNGRNPEITALAKALGIDRTKLADAIRDAKLAEVDKALADKRVTQAQADRLKQRIQAGEQGLFGFGLLAGRGHGFRHGPGAGRGDCPDGPGRRGSDDGTGTDRGSDRARPTAYFS